MSQSCCAASCQFTDFDNLSQSCGTNYAVFMGLLSYLISAQCDIANPCGHMGIDGSQLEDDASYDFIVVGAGAAGPVIAARLSENPDWNVLLLEAGPEEPTATLIPSFATSGIGTEVDWQYKTVRQENACLMTDGICSWPRGRMVSGSTGLNGMMYTRGHRSIYDNWEQEGNEGWGYDSLLNYFIKSEHNNNPETVDTEYHGFNGPLSVQQYPYQPPLTDSLIEAGIELGYPNIDVTGENQTGFAVAQMMVSDGLRATTTRMYLEPHKDRENLHLAINSQVTKIFINEEKDKAIAVQFIDTEGKEKTITANKEIILSAGAVGSPHILLLSGIGPREDLENLGIEVIQDLPVGENLHNHVSIGGIGYFINDTAYAALTLESFEDFLKTRKGPLASTGLTQTTAFVHSKYSESDAPDLQIFFDSYGASCSETGLPNECTDGTVGDCGRRYVNARPTNVLPKSRGYLKLNSTDPLDHPLIDPKYLTVQQDIDVLVDGIKISMSIANTSALQKWGFELDTTPQEGCEDQTFASDEYWECVVRTKTGAENHQAGSCKMGISSDTSVVDPKLIVHGINNLRVVDASIFPQMVNANPTPSIIAIAERASDLIKSVWG